MTLDECRLKKGWTYRDLAEAITAATKALGHVAKKCGVNLAWAYCQKPGSVNFKRPRDERMEAIWVLSDGEVTPGSFYRLRKLTRPFDRSAPELPLDETRATA